LVPDRGWHSSRQHHLTNIIDNNTQWVRGSIKNATKTRDKVNIISYADDFVITGSTRDILEYQVKPAVTAFLHERGLELSIEKTHLTSIYQGFDFLGFNIRKYDNNKLLIKPSKKNVTAFLDDIQTLIKSNSAVKTESLI